MVDDIQSKRSKSVRLYIGQMRDALSSARTPDVAASQGQNSGSASMALRKLHGYFGGDARLDNCRDALYRSHETNKIFNDKLTPEGTLAHCEHTIPVSIAVRHLWHFVYDASRNTLDHESLEKLLLERVFQNTLVTACSQRERNCSNGLAKSRSYDGGTTWRKWSRHHPGFPDCKVWDGQQKPFLRYHGTSIKVTCMTTNETLDLENFTLADHWERVKKHKWYEADQYFSI